MLTAAVVALGGQTLGVLVGEHRALGFHHSPGSEVLRCDQLEVRLLTLQFLADQRGNGRIASSECLVGLRHCRSGGQLGLIVRNRSSGASSRLAHKKTALWGGSFGCKARLERFELPTL